MKSKATKWQLAGAYVGGVVGAGFASGREHLQFFLPFGGNGFLGAALSGVIFMAGGAALLSLAGRHRTASHSELLEALTTPALARLFDLLLSVVTLTSVSVMMAGSGALLARVGLRGDVYGALLMGASAAMIVALGPKRMLNVNGAITAVLAASIAWVGISALVRGDAAAPFTAAGGLESDWIPDSWFGAATLYGLYNLTYGFTLFGALGGEVRRPVDARLGGILGGLALTALGLLVCIAVARTAPEASAWEVPMLAAAARIGGAIAYFYPVVIWSAMLTTAIAGIYTLARRLQTVAQVPIGFLGFAVAVVAFPLSLYGFRFLIATVYPISGYAGACCVVIAVLARRASVHRKPA